MKTLDLNPGALPPQGWCDALPEAAREKSNFHRAWKGRLRRLAKELELPSGSYEVRSCLGGPGVLGEVILHAERLYVVVVDEQRIMYRLCQGRKDYTGGPNHWLPVAKLLGEDRPLVLASLRRLVTGAELK